MKLSEPFFYDFDHEEIHEGIPISGKYEIAFDYEDGKVYNLYINLGSDCPSMWSGITLDLPNRGSRLHDYCKKHLEEL
jgi:hypothetical protein